MSKKQTIRKDFREAVFKRDKFVCVICKKKGKDRQGGDSHLKFHKNPEVDLDSHHITPREDIVNGGYIKENGITLCDDGCHVKAEAYLKGEDLNEQFSPANLYKLIGSSLELAIAAAEKL